MNGTMYSQDPSNGFYTGNGPTHPSYHNEYPSTFTPTVHIHQLYAPAGYNHINSQHTFKPLTPQSNRRDNGSQQTYYTNNLSTQQQSAQHNVYNFQNGGSAYYDQIHAQVRLNGPVYQRQISTATNATDTDSQYPHSHPLQTDLSKQPTPSIPNGHKEPSFLVVSANDPNISSPPLQVNS